MQKERKTVKQDRNKNSLAIKQSQGPLVLLQRLEIIFWAVSFELFCRDWNPLPSRRNHLEADHKHVDPRWVGTRRLMMLMPDYLTTNQSEECPWADHTPCNTLFSKTFPWKPAESLGLLKTSYLDSLLVPCSNAVFPSFSTTWCQ